MARKAVSAAAPKGEVQEFVVGQLEEARKRLVVFERELVKRGRAQQREVDVAQECPSGKATEGAREAGERGDGRSEEEARRPPGPSAGGAGRGVKSRITSGSNKQGA